MTLIGRVIESGQENMRTILTLTDSTGFLHVNFYHKDNNTPQPLVNFENKGDGSQWVQITGFIRVFGNEKSVIGINLKEITKMNLVTNHLLKCFVSNQMRHKGVLNVDDLEANKNQ